MADPVPNLVAGVPDLLKQCRQQLHCLCAAGFSSEASGSIRTNCEYSRNPHAGTNHLPAAKQRFNSTEVHQIDKTLDNSRIKTKARTVEETGEDLLLPKM